MAVTDTGHDQAKITRFFGLSTDGKPASAMIGATFYETDTRLGFVYTGAGWARDEQVTVEQAGAVQVGEVRSTTAILDDILTQLKIQNAYLSMVTGGELDETDIAMGVI